MKQILFLFLLTTSFAYGQAPANVDAVRMFLNKADNSLWFYSPSVGYVKVLGGDTSTTGTNNFSKAFKRAKYDSVLQEITFTRINNTDTIVSLANAAKQSETLITKNITTTGTNGITLKATNGTDTSYINLLPTTIEFYSKNKSISFNNLNLNVSRVGFPKKTLFAPDSSGTIARKEDIQDAAPPPHTGVTIHTEPNGNKHLDVGGLVYEDINWDGFDKYVFNMRKMQWLWIDGRMKISRFSNGTSTMPQVVWDSTSKELRLIAAGSGTGGGGGIVTEQDPLSVHITDSAGMLDGYVRKFILVDSLRRLREDLFVPLWVKNITQTNIANWNTAYAWGNHAGLYRPITYVPSWSEITGKPAFHIVATSGDYNDLINKPTGSAGGSVTSVFRRTGAIVSATGDYTTDQVTEATNKYYTDTRSRAAITLTQNAGGNSYSQTTGVLNISPSANSTQTFEQVLNAGNTLSANKDINVAGKTLTFNSTDINGGGVPTGKVIVNTDFQTNGTATVNSLISNSNISAGDEIHSDAALSAPNFYVIKPGGIFSTINATQLTANRNHQLPNKDGTFAMLSDITNTGYPTTLTRKTNTQFLTHTDTLVLERNGMAPLKLEVAHAFDLGKNQVWNPYSPRWQLIGVLDSFPIDRRTISNNVLYPNYQNSTTVIYTNPGSTYHEIGRPSTAPPGHYHMVKNRTGGTIYLSTAHSYQGDPDNLDFFTNTDVGHLTLTNGQSVFLMNDGVRWNVMFYTDGTYLTGGGGGTGGGSAYTLPIATPTALGGVKVGNGLAIDGTGLLSATGTGGGGGQLYFDTTIVGTGTFANPLRADTIKWIATKASVKKSIDSVAALIPAGGSGGTSFASTYTSATIGTGNGNQAAQTVSGASFTTINLVAANDLGSHFNNTTHVYTVPSSGTYYISAKIRHRDNQPSGISIGMGMDIVNADNPSFFWGVTNGQREGLQNSRIMSLTAGDAVRLYTYCNTTLDVATAEINIYRIF